ncbi:MAG TPA: hypothetical protein VM577_18870 [Anaerovoracaceae bacterium]|nr:hypothetical protein [Anaerovoracaceae bacterium]
MKKLLLLLALAGCVPTSDIHSAEMDRRMESGALCQGSRAWQEHNLCGPGTDSGLCIEAVRGPFILTGVDSGEGCPHPLSIGIKDTFTNPDKINSGWTVENRVHWTMTGPSNTRLYIHNIEKVIPAGESLFIGTNGFNSIVDSSRCYVTWVGYRPKE